MVTENLSTLKIHKLTEEQYQRELAAGRIDENALYLTPWEESTDLDLYATQEYVDEGLATKQPIGDYAFKSDINEKLNKSELPAAINTALAQAKNSGEFQGEQGIQGPKGDTGTSVTVRNVSESSADGGNNVITFSDGKTITIKNGKTGSTGTAGKDGRTPVRGTDYWTSTDIAEIKSYLDEVILKGEW